MEVLQLHVLFVSARRFAFLRDMTAVASTRSVIGFATGNYANGMQFTPVATSVQKVRYMGSARLFAGFVLRAKPPARRRLQPSMELSSPICGRLAESWAAP